jgi:flagellar hook-basal body complex protein FliE
LDFELLVNKQKTICSIWKKNLSVSISSEMKSQTEQAIANLIHEMIDDVSKDWLKTNTDSKQLIFDINKFQDL